MCDYDLDVGDQSAPLSFKGGRVVGCLPVGALCNGHLPRWMVMLMVAVMVVVVVGGYRS